MYVSINWLEKKVSYWAYIEEPPQMPVSALITLQWLQSLYLLFLYWYEPVSELIIPVI